MCKFTKKPARRHSRSARLKIIFLCIMLIALDHPLSVQAANIYTGELLFNDLRTSVSSLCRIMSGPAVSLTLREQSGLNYNVYSYDAKLPCCLYFEHPFNAFSYTASATGKLFVIDFKVSQDCNLNSITCSDERVSLIVRPPYGTLKQGQFAEVAVYVNFFDLPMYGQRSITFNLNFNLTSTPGTNTSPVFVTLDAFCVSTVQFFADNFTLGTVVPNLDRIGDAVDKVDDTLKDQRDDDRDKATQGGDDASKLVSDLDSQIKTRWKILWYPVEFTQSLLSVFTGGSSSRAYVSKYADVVAYTYNEQTGYVEPVRDRSRAQARAGGTVITFPGFTISGMQAWAPYDFDLSQLKSWFPALFDALYVIVSVLELYWFVSFLLDKYHEVFG